MRFCPFLSKIEIKSNRKDKHKTGKKEGEYVPESERIALHYLKITRISRQTKPRHPKATVEELRSRERERERENNKMEQDDKISSKEMKTSENPAKKKKKAAENSCRRFSDEQVKLLESVFSQATKLEPRKKVQLAKDIGLHPRQVSIWFQNKRARWRSKQIESEYRVLKDDFDALNQQFESLKKENESLLEQIQTLRSLFENGQGGYGDSEITRNKISEAKENNINNDDESNWGLCSDEDDDHESSGVEKYLVRKNHKKQEILQFLSMQSSEHGSSSLASPDKNWCDLPVPSGGFLDDESCSPSSWWN